MTTATATETQQIGRVVQIIGPAVDIEFGEGHLPALQSAIRIVDNGELGKVPIDVIVEVANHIGENQVRCIAMKPTDGMVRGMKAIDTGGPISVPVGRETLGNNVPVVINIAAGAITEYVINVPAGTDTLVATITQPCPSAKTRSASACRPRGSLGSDAGSPGEARSRRTGDTFRELVPGNPAGEATPG